MKAILLALFALTASIQAFAGAEEFSCVGIKQSTGMTLYVKALSNTNVPEGRKMSYFLKITSRGLPVFAGNVSATQEDVMLKFFYQKTRTDLDGTIYLDELEQSWISIDNEEFRFDCN